MKAIVGLMGHDTDLGFPLLFAAYIGIRQLLRHPTDYLWILLLLLMIAYITFEFFRAWFRHLPINADQSALKGCVRVLMIFGSLGPGALWFSLGMLSSFSTLGYTLIFVLTLPCFLLVGVIDWRLSERASAWERVIVAGAVGLLGSALTI